MNEEIECKTHPDAPHGFVRNASHTEDRLVCECEYWEEPKVNKRIRELAEQALNYAEKNQSADIPQHWFKLHTEKFAELIVQEVIKIAEDTKNYNRTIYTTHDLDRAKALMSDLIKSIKQQLG